MSENITIEGGTLLHVTDLDLLDDILDSGLKVSEPICTEGREVICFSMLSRFRRASDIPFGPDDEEFIAFGLVPEQVRAIKDRLYLVGSGFLDMDEPKPPYPDFGILNRSDEGLNCYGDEVRTDEDMELSDISFVLVASANIRAKVARKLHRKKVGLSVISLDQFLK